MRHGRVGVVGCYGAVGAAVVDRLRAIGVPIRLGGRARDRVAAEVARAGHAAEPAVVDIAESDAFERFCEGCAVVVNATSDRALAPRAVAAAWRAGTDYVDVSGGDEILQLLAAVGVGPGRRAIVGAGVMPGLSGLVALAAAGLLDNPFELIGYVGGCGRLTAGSAAEFLSGVLDGFGEPFAMWSGGRRRSRALATLREAELPAFPRAVEAHPFFSNEAERVARRLGVNRSCWYTVYDGHHLPSALGRIVAASTDDAEAVEALVRAAALDAFGRVPYYRLVMTAAGERCGKAATVTVVVNADDAITLTGAVAAHAACVVLDSGVPKGAHHAADVLDPTDALAQLTEAGVASVWSEAAETVEEGAL